MREGEDGERVDHVAEDREVSVCFFRDCHLLVPQDLALAAEDEEGREVRKVAPEGRVDGGRVARGRVGRRVREERDEVAWAGTSVRDSRL